MQEIQVKCPPAIAGSVWDAYSGSGLVWALNCSASVDGEGIYLWRPSVVTDTTFSAFTTRDDYYDAVCAKGRINLLVNTGSGLGIKWWDGVNSGVAVGSLPVVPKGQAQLTSYGDSLVAGVRGKGLFLFEWDEGLQNWTKVYRLGSMLFSSGDSSQVVGVNTSVPVDLFQISWSDASLSGIPHYVSRIVLWGALPAEGLPDYEWTLEIVDGNNQATQAKETYRRDSLLPPLTNVPVQWRPLTFTFMKEFTLPIKVRIKVISGNAEMILEGASKVEQGIGLAVNWLTPNNVPVHCSVGGTLCPDGEVVFGFRGSLFGVRKDKFVQIAGFGDLEFNEEFPIESRPIKMVSYQDGLFLFCEQKVIQIVGWTAKGVEAREIVPYGVSSMYSVAVTSSGIWFWADGRLFNVGSGLRIYPCVVQGLEGADVVISALDILDYIILNVPNRSVHLVFSPLNEGWFFWRFDETGNKEVIGSCKGLLVFNDGVVRPYSRRQCLPSYAVELFLLSGRLERKADFQVQALELDGHFYQEAGKEYLRVKVFGFGDNRISAVEEGFIGVKKTSSFDVEGFAESTGAGLLELVPQNGEGVIVMNYGFPFVFPSQVKTDTNSQVGVLEDGFLVGKKFGIAIYIPADIPKHPANRLVAVRLYGSVVGSEVLA